MSTLTPHVEMYAPGMALDALLPKKYRTYALRVLLVLLVFFGIGILGYVSFDSIRSGGFTLDGLFETMAPVTGIFLILLGVYGILLLTTWYYNTLYFRGVRSVHDGDSAHETGITFEVALILADSDTDLTHGFLTSSYGREIMIRTGIDAESVQNFLQGSRQLIHVDTLSLLPDRFMTLQDVGEFLLNTDLSFNEFLFQHGVTPELFIGANEWVSRVRILYKKRLRFWSRDALGTITGIGRELSYGTAYTLKKYQRDINTTSAFSVFLSDTAYANDIIEHIEATLTRVKSSNVLLIGEPGVGKMDILIEFGRRIREGHSLASLSAKRLVVLDTDVFVASHSSKEEFESSFLGLMEQTEHAGNIIIVIENFSHFLRSVASLGVDAGGLLERYLSSPYVQIVGTVDPQNYHAEIESNHALLQYFEPIMIAVPDLSSSIRVLEEATWVHEHTHHLYFTYPALVRIAECAEQYIVEGVMPDKAVSLLADIAVHAGQEKVRIIDTAFVDTSVSLKTGIPSGPMSTDEREILMHLEEILHKRVVGQHRAIEVIASAMRRARAGIQSTEKPIGTFLFLGSTGVGKTETAKALAHTFFESEEHMVRFDMSEYSGQDALSRLLGTKDTPGALSSALREHPYCVLLLDEFEKSAEAVRDIFLQVFDEGVCTDARGAKVNARNTIIIATSNAGSDLIWKYMQEGKHPEEEKETIINTIIERHVYRPELLNRFDAVVLFEALDPAEQRTIAGLMLTDLQERIKKRGYELIVDDVLLTALMKEGYNPEFGARPMRRAIQDLVEEKVARKILEGGLRPGASIHFMPEDFQRSE